MGYFYFYGSLIFIAVIIQSLAVLPEFAFGIHPDLLLIVLTMGAINYGKTAGGVLGFTAGLLQDWFSGGLFGIHAVSKTITGYLCGFLKNHIYQDHFLTPPVITVLATIVNQLLILFFTNLLLEVTVLKQLLITIIIPLAIYNAIISLLFYPLISKLESLLARRKFW
ncbi:MAG: rod shape-determining protein MreD [Bacillota bacterium]